MLEVARDLVGCTLSHAGASGVIVETEAYHQSEAACHAYVGLTPRTRVLFGPPAHAYVYRSYGIHALLNAVCDAEGVGAAVLIRALEPLAGIELMRERRGMLAVGQLCSGPGKLTQALAIGLELDDTSLVGGAIEIAPRAAYGPSPPVLASAPRVGTTRALELPWRFSLAGSASVSRPQPAGQRRPSPGRAGRPRPGA